VRRRCRERMHAEFRVVTLKWLCVGKCRQPCRCQGAVETGEIGRLEWTPAARSLEWDGELLLLVTLLDDMSSQLYRPTYQTYCVS
jgi:hypothetical protein